MINSGKYNYRGFTLIEILVVVSIIGALAVVAAVSFNHVRAKERDSRRMADIQKMVLGLEQYRNVYRQYPSCFVEGASYYYNIITSRHEAWASCLGEKLKPFIGEIPVDPKNDAWHMYSYKEQRSYMVPHDDNRSVVLDYSLENYQPHTTSYSTYVLFQGTTDYFVGSITLQRYRNY